MVNFPGKVQYVAHGNKLSTNQIAETISVTATNVEFQKLSTYQSAETRSLYGKQPIGRQSQSPVQTDSNMEDQTGLRFTNTASRENQSSS